MLCKIVITSFVENCLTYHTGILLFASCVVSFMVMYSSENKERKQRSSFSAALNQMQIMHIWKEMMASWF